MALAAFDDSGGHGGLRFRERRYFLGHQVVRFAGPSPLPIIGLEFCLRRDPWLLACQPMSFPSLHRRDNAKQLNSDDLRAWGIRIFGRPSSAHNAGMFCWR
jgi:hypothetical protein